MRWIKSRPKFVIEAKIGDLILKRQSREVIEQWGEIFLNYEEIDPNENLKLGKWKLEGEDRDEVLSTFFNANIPEMRSLFDKIPEKFADTIQKSLDLNILSEEYKIIFENFNIRNPSIEQICHMFSNVFRKLSVSETKSKELVVRDSSGRPERDENGDIKKIKKEEGDPVFSDTSRVNINTFILDYQRCYDEPGGLDFGSILSNRAVQNIKNYLSDMTNPGYKNDFELFNKDMYLSILHNPKDILNISISKFYSSCQHLYDGGYRNQLLANVFDPNSVPAFIYLDTPMYMEGEKISETVPLCRVFVRVTEIFTPKDDGGNGIKFDRTYPIRMEPVMFKLITKYSSMVQNARTSRYYWTPDLPPGVHIDYPYMDTLSLYDGVYVGSNTTSLKLSRDIDWSKIIFSKKTKLKELIIETISVPEQLLKAELNLDWLKFQYLNVINLNPFSNWKSKGISFNKCKLNSDILQKCKDMKIKNYNFISCSMSDIDLSSISPIDSLSIVYSLDSQSNIEPLLNGVEFKELVISGDLLSSKENKEFIKSQKDKKIKIKIVGPVL